MSGAGSMKVRVLFTAAALLTVAGCRDWDGAYDACADAGLCYDPAAPVLALSTETLPDAYQGAAYGAPLTATGGRAPYSFTVLPGLPTGMAVSSAGLSGTPTVSGTFALTLRVTDALGALAERSVSLNVVPPPAVNAAVPDGYVGELANATLTVTGGKAPYTFGILSGALPEGLRLISTGVLDGTYQTAGTFDVTVQVTDANTLTATRTLRLNVYAPVALVAGTPADAYTDAAYGMNFTPTGGKAPLTFAQVTGTIPAGLTLSSAGALTGTATVTGAFTFELEVSDANARTARRSVTLNVYAPPALGVITAPDAYTDATYSLPLPLTGGKNPTLQFTAGTLPAGMTLVAAELTGKPTNANVTANLTLEATDANGRKASRAFTLNTYAPPACAALTTLPDAYTDVEYAQTLTATGGKGTLEFRLDTGLPPDGILLSTSGAVSGKATSGEGTPTDFVVEVSDVNSRKASCPVRLSAYAPPTFTAPSPIPPAYAGETYAATFTPSGGKGLRVFSKMAGTFPAGLDVTAAGVVSGTVGAAVTQNATVPFTLRVTDDNGRTFDLPVEIRTYQPPAITTTALAGAIEGVAYRNASGGAVQVSGANGASPYTLTSTSLPGGLSLATDGTLSGIPAQGSAGTRQVPFVLRDANGRGPPEKILDLVIASATALAGGGTRGIAPTGSPITTTLTVFVTDARGNGLPAIGVRLRKNQLEYSPPKEAFTGAGGKVVFEGLDLNGTTDTVDITVNGKGIANTTLAQVNAAVVTLVPYGVPVPAPRFGASMIWDQPRARLLLTQGGDQGQMQRMMTQDLVAFQPSSGTWVELFPQGMVNAPPPRMYAAFGRSGLFTAPTQVLFGGYDAYLGVMLGDTWEYNGSAGTTGSWTRQLSAVAPSSRAGAATVTDASDNLWLLGGDNTMGALSDLWRYDLGNHTWVRVTPANSGPTITVGMAAARDASNRLWFCGGSSSLWGDGEASACWIYDVDTNSWTPGPALPEGRSFASMAYLAPSLYLFGGRDAAGVVRGDLLRLNSGVWEPVAAAGGPPPRYAANFVDSNTTWGLFLFGGLPAVEGTTASAAVPYSDLWTYKDTEGWTLRTATAAPAGLTLSGTITGAHAASRSTATVHVSTDAGFTVSTRVNVPSGGGPYAISGLPAGVTLKVHAINSSPTAGVAANLYSFVDKGTVGPLSADTVLDVQFPGKVSPTTAQANLTPPASWTPGAGTTFGATSAERPGFTRTTNGAAVQVVGTETIQLSYFPLPGAQQLATLGGYSLEPTDCQYRYVYPTVTGSALGTFTLPGMVTGQNVGRVDCDPSGDGFGAIQFGNGLNGATMNAAADLNSDGKDDLVTLFPTSNAVGVFLSAANKTRRLVDVTTGPEPRLVALGRLAGDPAVDLVIVHTWGIRAMQGDNAGAFVFGGEQTSELPNPTGVALVDMTGDGLNDLVVLDSGDGSLHPDATLVVFEGSSDGSLAPALRFTLGPAGRWHLAAGQTLPNGPVHVAVASEYSIDQQVIVHDSSIMEQFRSIRVAGAGRATDVAFADVNGTPGRDVLRVDGQNAVVWTYQEAGAEYLPHASIPVACPPRHVVPVELRGDARSELVLVCDDRLITLAFDGAEWRVLQDLGTWIQEPIALDFDGNGISDLAPGGDWQTVYPGRRAPVVVSDGTYQFVAPAGTQTFFSYRFGLGGAPEWQYTGPAAPGLVTFSYPLPHSTAPSRPWPAGRDVVWDQNVRMYGAGWNYNHSSVADRPAQLVGTSFFEYRR